jgi:hypothetical protein
MADRVYKKLRTGDRIIDGIQDNIDTVISPIATNDFVYGNILKNITLTFGVANIVKHKLGREAQGYIIIKRNTDGIVWDTSNDFPDRNLTLHSSKDVIVNLYVF